MTRALLLLLVACGTLAAASCGPASRAELLDLDTLEQLQARFNHDRGQPRLVLLLSPT